MTDERALHAAILAEPDEDTPRLIYADEIQDTQPERAEFVRVQCALAGLEVQQRFMRGECSGRCHREKRCAACAAVNAWNESVKSLRRRERELLQGGREWITAFWSKHLDGWIRGLPGKVPCLAKTEPAVTVGAGDAAVGPPKKYTFVRGFVGAVECSAADWLAFGDAIRREHPVRAVALSTWGREIYDLELYHVANEPPTYHSRRWPGVAFRAAGRPVELDTKPTASPELLDAMTVAGLEESPPVTQADWDNMISTLLSPPPEGNG